MYEMLDDTAAQVILAIGSGDSIRRVAHHLHTPYEAVRQAMNRLEDVGYVTYDDGLSVVFLDEIDQFEEPSVTTTAEYR
jgi:Mn-dependent DtxR family transcriptional regulator